MDVKGTNAPEQPQWDTYWSVLKRRRRWFLVPIIAGWAIVWAISWLVPPVYRSEALILVEEQKVPKDYVVPNVTTGIQERLQTLTQQIMSRTRLQHIIEQYHLYPKEAERLSLDEHIDRMRKDIEIELVQSKDRKELTAFRIYYSAPNPVLAQSVTAELTSLFIDENLRNREQLTESTTAFLRQQLDEAGKHLGEQEQKIREYKAQYIGQLPSQLESNVQILTGLQGQSHLEEDELNRAKQHNLYLESLLEQYRNRHDDITDGKTVQLPEALDQELTRLKTELADASAHDTEDHPDIIKLKSQIAATSKMRKQISDDLSTPAAPDSTAKTTPDNHASLTTAPAMQLESELKANRLEMENRDRELKQLQARIEDYRVRLNQTPMREQQLSDLMRDYDQSHANYESLLAKKNQSELATNLEKRQGGEQFTVIDPPSLPQKLYGPNRFAWNWIGLGLGVLLGLVTGAGTEMGDDRVHSEKELKALFKAPVLTEIPPLPTAEEMRAQSRVRTLEWVFVVLIVAVITTGSLVSYYHG
jgi:polysaccharide chain length determinant protein (PEP-CTERM system associated)